MRASAAAGRPRRCAVCSASPLLRSHPAVFRRVVPAYQSEDCLNLNVFTPALGVTPAEAPVPVLVFFHGCVAARPGMGVVNAADALTLLRAAARLSPAAMQGLLASTRGRASLRAATSWCVSPRAPRRVAPALTIISRWSAQTIGWMHSAGSSQAPKTEPWATLGFWTSVRRCAGLLPTLPTSAATQAA